MNDLPLITDTRALLERHRGRWPEVAVEASISHAWLSKFVRGEIHNPGVRTLQRVHDVLVGMDPAPSDEEAA